jgi:hypothetical protein
MHQFFNTRRFFLAPDGIAGDQKDSADQADQKQKEDSQGTKPDGDALSKMVNEAVKKAADERDKFWQSKFDQKNTELQRSKAEQEKILKEKMSEDERGKYEREQRERELTEKETRIKQSELRLSKITALNKAGLDVKFETLISGSSDEEIAENVAAINEAIRAEVAKALKEKLSEGAKPGQGTSSSSGKSITYAEFMDLSPAERSKFMSSGGTLKD